MATETVFNEVQLASAIADPNVNTIVLGADIELESGIEIPAEKEFLIFDGEYEDSIHNLTDVNSILQSETIKVNADSDISIAFRNMTMTGRNYFGIPSIYEGADTGGVTVIYENITYTGPQLVFNPLGLTRFINCDVTISPPDAHEAGEVCCLEFEGENTITHNATNDSSKAVFWFRGEIGKAYFKVLPDAKLTVNTVNYFMHAYDAISVPVKYEILPNASFTLNANFGISHSLVHRVSSFLIDNGASFRYVQETTNLLYASLYLSGDFIVKEGASVYMQADFDNAQHFIYFPAGTDIEFNINKPKSFVLYKRTASMFSALIGGTKSYSITAEQLNHWTIAHGFPGAGTFTDDPQSKWHNSDWSVFTMYGVFTSNSTSVYETGLVNPDFPISNFNFQNARVISAGNLLIEPDPVIDNGRPITGTTEPLANLIISFEVDEYDYVFDTVTADTDGRFELDPQMQIPVDTVITIKVNTPFLIKTITTSVVPTGSVTIIDAPDRIAFSIPPVSFNPVLLRRSLSKFPLKVVDSRPYPTDWNLKALISGPLRALGGEVLENAVVYKNSLGELEELNETPITVYSGEAFTGTTNIDWNEDEGILVRITGSVRSGAEYTTDLAWSLEVIED